MRETAELLNGRPQSPPTLRLGGVEMDSADQYLGTSKQDASSASLLEPIFSWNPHLQVEKSETAERLGPDPQSLKSPSTIDDSGDAQQLLNSAATNQQEPVLPGVYRSDTELSHTGGHPRLNSFPLDRRESTISLTEDGSSLGADLRGAMEKSAGENSKDFLPFDMLEHIITLERVKKELRAFGLENHADSIFGSPSKGNPTSRRKLFALLVLVEEIESIGSIIADGLFDNALPFVLQDKRRRFLVRKEKESDPNAPCLSFCSSWRTPAREQFESYQWQLLAPFFKLSKPSDSKVLHYRLDDNQVLPFTEIESLRAGGFGEVSKIKLHPAHHNYHDLEHNGNDFAVKKLKRGHKQDYDEAFRNEKKVLQRLNEKNHEHLIRLLATYHYRGDYYLVFPWAGGGNLQDLWRNGFGRKTGLLADGRLERWMVYQLLGICQGLQIIHKCEFKDGDLINIIGSLDHEEIKERKYGRHGDLRPENILWFNRHFLDDCSVGHLKICDFGMTSFHRSMSRSNVDAETVGMSRTYRAPEIDTRPQISPKYDIWTLGCIFLDFATWRVEGWRGNESFEDRRFREHEGDAPGVIEDAFFNLGDLQHEGEIVYGAKMKECVHQQFNNLRAAPDATDFLQDLLNFVQDRMLRMSPENRADIEEVVKKLEEIGDKCGCLEYCTKQQLAPMLRTGTNLSEIEKAPRIMKTQNRRSALFMDATIGQPRSFSKGMGLDVIPSVPELRVPTHSTVGEKADVPPEETKEIGEQSQNMFPKTLQPDTNAITPREEAGRLSREPSDATASLVPVDSTFSTTPVDERPPTPVTPISMSTATSDVRHPRSEELPSMIPETKDQYMKPPADETSHLAPSNISIRESTKLDGISFHYGIQRRTVKEIVCVGNPTDNKRRHGVWRKSWTHIRRFLQKMRLVRGVDNEELYWQH